MRWRLYWWWYGVWARFGGPLKAAELRWNHPDYVAILRGDRPLPPGPRCEWVCRFVDAISSNWFHD